MALTFTTFELEHLSGLLQQSGGWPSEFLTPAEVKNLTTKVKHEISLRDRAASENNIEPGVRAQQYRVNDKTVITRYEKAMPAQGVSAPKKRPDGSGVTIDSVDHLLMLLGTGEDLIPDA